MQDIIISAVLQYAVMGSGQRNVLDMIRFIGGYDFSPLTVVLCDKTKVKIQAESRRFGRPFGEPLTYRWRDACFKKKRVQMGQKQIEKRTLHSGL